MTWKQAKTIAREIGANINRTPFGDIRVSLKGASAEADYYTDDLSDAVATARRMRRIVNDCTVVDAIFIEEGGR